MFFYSNLRALVKPFGIYFLTSGMSSPAGTDLPRWTWARSSWAPSRRKLCPCWQRMITMPGPESASDRDGPTELSRSPQSSWAQPTKNAFRDEQIYMYTLYFSQFFFTLAFFFLGRESKAEPLSCSLQPSWWENKETGQGDGDRGPQYPLCLWIHFRTLEQGAGYVC